MAAVLDPLPMVSFFPEIVSPSTNLASAALAAMVGTVPRALAGVSGTVSQQQLQQQVQFSQVTQALSPSIQAASPFLGVNPIFAQQQQQHTQTPQLSPISTGPSVPHVLSYRTDIPSISSSDIQLAVTQRLGVRLCIR